MKPFKQNPMSFIKERNSESWRQNWPRLKKDAVPGLGKAYGDSGSDAGA